LRRRKSRESCKGKYQARHQWCLGSGSPKYQASDGMAQSGHPILRDVATSATRTGSLEASTLKPGLSICGTPPSTHVRQRRELKSDPAAAARGFSTAIEETIAPPNEPRGGADHWQNNLSCQGFPPVAQCSIRTLLDDPDKSPSSEPLANSILNFVGERYVSATKAGHWGNA
jgi:hypothetical protein